MPTPSRKSRYCARIDRQTTAGLWLQVSGLTFDRREIVINKQIA